ncbi:MAG: hypothetical protein HOB98_17935 [Gammaproteobacteria bacterium]|jgi:hypothetical protein|nr:hypothetical protein [Gammaproteobacteria bacterium]MBT4378631.1 hypothetical protein [Gammaproteobacteria bacterium]MBT4618329.1 hypothetical protein [Gammaproteobacteria bacterium]MBT5199485.1 hypothetical protein [Gammaproteobacteria bacterium]MBT5441307.1 hypothetical protein [Gammaproteobacteria bacterium]
MHDSQHAAHHLRVGSKQVAQGEWDALLITDSFGIYTAEHLAPGFKTLIHVNVTDLKEGEMSNFYGEMIDKIAPDRILFLFNDQSFIGRYALNRIRVATVVRPVKESDIQ